MKNRDAGPYGARWFKGSAELDPLKIYINLPTSEELRMSLHPTTYQYLKPSEAQIEKMARVRAAAKAYSDVLDAELPDGADKTFVLRAHRSNAMWANVAITRLQDGSPRDDVP